MVSSIQASVSLLIAEDNLKAWLQTSEGVPLESITRQTILDLLDGQKIQIDDLVNLRIDKFLEMVAKPDDWEEEFPVAEGTPPIASEPGKFDWDESLQGIEEEGDELAAVDYREAKAVRTVEQGAILGKIVAPVPGTPGTDIHGNVIKVSASRSEVKISNGARIEEDGQTVVAEVTGRALFSRGKISVAEIFDVKGDVDFESGNINSTIDVVIRGSIQDLFKVNTNGSVTVGQAVQAAKIEAGGDVTVSGGILCRNKGSVRAGGSVMAKFCDEADIVAGQDILIAKEAINSRMFASKSVVSERAAIIGGEVYARNSVEIASIGSDACVPTIVGVGTHPAAARKAAQHAGELAAHAEQIQSLRAVVKKISPGSKLQDSQKEQLKALTDRLKELEQIVKAKKKEQQRDASEESPERQPYIRVLGRICQKCVLSIDDKEVRFFDEMKGPLRFEKRQIKHVTEFVAVNELTGSITTLNSHLIEPD